MSDELTIYDTLEGNLAELRLVKDPFYTIEDAEVRKELMKALANHLMQSERGVRMWVAAAQSLDLEAENRKQKVHGVTCDKKGLKQEPVPFDLQVELLERFRRLSRGE